MEPEKTKFSWQVRWGFALLCVAMAFDLLHVALFGDRGYIARFIMAQLGFLPVSIFVVTVVINQLLAGRERRSLLNKMNMVIGAFFSEVGTGLLGHVRVGGGKRTAFDVSADWREADFAAAAGMVDELEIAGTMDSAEIEALRRYLSGKRDFLLSLLANPNLLEHDSFTETLWAVLHVNEELACRGEIAALPSTDIEHLRGDINRALRAVLREWLSYMQHLQQDYPYLFSLAVRTNPLRPDRSPVVR